MLFKKDTTPKKDSDEDGIADCNSNKFNFDNLTVTPLSVKEKSFIDKIKRDNSIMRDKSVEILPDDNLLPNKIDYDEHKLPNETESPHKSSK